MRWQAAAALAAAAFAAGDFAAAALAASGANPIIDLETAMASSLRALKFFSHRSASSSVWKPFFVLCRLAPRASR